MKLCATVQPVRYWLRRYFGIEETQGEARSKRSFNRRLDELIEATPDRRLADELDRTRSFLGALIGLRWADSLYEQLDAQGRYTNTFIGLTSLVQAESLRLPVVWCGRHTLWIRFDPFPPTYARFSSLPDRPTRSAWLPPRGLARRPGGVRQNCQSLRLKGWTAIILRVLIQNQLATAAPPCRMAGGRARGTRSMPSRSAVLKAENQLCARRRAGFAPSGGNLPANISSLVSPPRHRAAR